jgi:hypothetical protein
MFILQSTVYEFKDQRDIRYSLELNELTLEYTIYKHINDTSIEMHVGNEALSTDDTYIRSLLEKALKKVKQKI